MAIPFLVSEIFEVKLFTAITRFMLWTTVRLLILQVWGVFFLAQDNVSGMLERTKCSLYLALLHSNVFPLCWFMLCLSHRFLGTSTPDLSI